MGKFRGLRRSSQVSIIPHHPSPCTSPSVMKRTRLIHPAAHKRAFTLVEIMIVVAIIALLAAIAVPGFLRSRKRAQGVAVLTDLRLIDGAMDQYALEYNRSANATIKVAAWKMYIKPGTRLYNTGGDIFGDLYGDQTLSILPPVPSAAWDSLSDVCDASFWSPYVRGQ